MRFDVRLAAEAIENYRQLSARARAEIRALPRGENLMRRVALSEVKDDFSRYLRLAESEEIIITRHGKPAGVLIGFETEDEWFDYRLQNDPRFLALIEAARESVRAGRTTPLEELAEEA